MTWEAFSASLVILSALSSVIVQAFFHMLHNHRHYQIENIVKDTGRHQGHNGSLRRRDLLGDGKHFGNR